MTDIGTDVASTTSAESGQIPASLEAIVSGDGLQIRDINASIYAGSHTDNSSTHTTNIAVYADRFRDPNSTSRCQCPKGSTPLIIPILDVWNAFLAIIPGALRRREPKVPFIEIHTEQPSAPLDSQCPNPGLSPPTGVTYLGSLWSGLLAAISYIAPAASRSEDPEPTGTLVDLNRLPTNSWLEPGTPSPAEIYVCDLMRWGDGLPCYYPQPTHHRPEGIVPYDVGTYSANAGFRWLFNLEEDMALGVAPCGSYSPSPHFEDDATVAPSCEVNSPPDANQVCVMHEFTLPSTAGGILAVLSAADIISLEDKNAMQAYILKNAENLYRCACKNPGFSSGDSLYIITACIKGDVWAQGTFQPHHSVPPRRLQLSRTAKPTPDNPASSYKWTQRPAETRTHRKDSGTKRINSQTFFLQGFKLAFSSAFVSRAKDGLEVPSPDSKGTLGHRGPDVDSSRHDTSSGAPGSNCGQTPPPRDCPTNSSPSGKSQLSTEIKNMENNVECLQFPPCAGKEYHPCDIINKMLLGKTGADFALSHDDDWRDAFHDRSMSLGATSMGTSVGKSFPELDSPRPLNVYPVDRDLSSGGYADVSTATIDDSANECAKSGEDNTFETVLCGLGNSA